MIIAGRGFFSIFVSILLIAISRPSLGAEINFLNIADIGGVPTFQLTLFGQIQKGDSIVISRILDGLGFGVKNSDGTIVSKIDRAVLYLNSPGGDYGEGIAIAKLLSKRNVQSVVGKDSSCFSSCAIAFLGGTILGDEDRELTSRTVESGGVLGFHAPYLIVEAGNYDKQTIEFAYREAVSNIAELIRLSRIVGLPPEILPEVLDVKKDGIDTLVTVDDFARFGVASRPVPPVPFVTRSMITNACRNGYAWRHSRVRGEGEKVLLDVAQNNFENFESFQIRTKYFSNDEVLAVRSVVGTSVEREDGLDWCLFDHAIIEGRLHSTCRGFISAPSLDEAVQRAKKFDSNGEYGTPEVACALSFSTDAAVDFDADNTLAFVPASTKIEDVEKTISKILNTEKQIISRK